MWKVLVVILTVVLGSAGNILMQEHYATNIMKSNQVLLHEINVNTQGIEYTSEQVHKLHLIQYTKVCI